MNTFADDLEVALATQVKVELAERDMSQAELAEAVGIGRPALNRYLKGHQSMPMPVFFAVAQAFGLSPRALMEAAEARIARRADRTA